MFDFALRGTPQVSAIFNFCRRASPAVIRGAFCAPDECAGQHFLRFFVRGRGGENGVPEYGAFVRSFCGSGMLGRVEATRAEPRRMRGSEKTP